ncbi:hydroxyacylglutathione hydrolase [Derxia gummosa]|uniref:Hydroxyacylglutathione hydrolase n=1 Tax=Derxia gummosa DSM 723 TaxID=1121388 RepID=A0A8B6X2U5_9BURK|nr:hydroxyacylglutathione hydrolase [Derxia gummosa]
MLAVHALPAFADNYLWLIEDGSRAAVVDPGDAEVVRHALAERGLALAAILLTHHHADHTGGVAALSAEQPCVVHGPAAEAIAGVTEPHVGGERFELLGQTVEVISVPGHTRGHIAYFIPRLAALFCGDTLFAAGCGRLFEGTPAQMWASLSRLARLPGSTAVHCAHEYTLGNLKFARAVEPGNRVLAEREARARELRAAGRPTLPSSIALELETNPFLRAADPAVQARASEAEQLPEVARQSVSWEGLTGAERSFAVLRAWKNVFS